MEDGQAEGTVKCITLPPSRQGGVTLPANAGTGVGVGGVGGVQQTLVLEEVWDANTQRYYKMDKETGLVYADTRPGDWPQVR